MIKLLLEDSIVEVGDKIIGKAVWVSEHRPKRPLDLSIGWQTSGAGEEEKRCIFAQKIYPSDEEFSFLCPISALAPTSYHGLFLKITWKILITEVKFLGNFTVESENIRVVPRRIKGVQQEEH